MKIAFNQEYAIITRQHFDKKVYRDTTLLYHIKNKLNQITNKYSRHKFVKMKTFLITGDHKTKYGEILMLFFKTENYNFRQYNTFEPVELIIHSFIKDKHQRKHTFRFPDWYYNEVVVNLAAVEKIEDKELVRADVWFDDMHIWEGEFISDKSYTYRATARKALQMVKTDKQTMNILKRI
jgi:hypothetical protein